MKIKLDDGAFTPTRAFSTDAGLDLRSRTTVMIWPGTSETFSTGVHVEIPSGCYGKIEGKSGLNTIHHVTPTGGVIDEGYTGEIMVTLRNFGRTGYTVKRGDKIAQLLIIPCLTPELEIVDELEETERGTGGFGSTGR